MWSKNYYVYALVDPRDWEPFYIGKGKGRRCHQHLKDWRRGYVINAEKHDRIGEIVQEGMLPEPVVVKDGMTEDEAFEFERMLIREIGFHRLTNVLPGQQTAEQKAMAVVRHYLGLVKPFGVWAEERPRSEYEVSLYHRVVDCLRQSLTGEEPETYGWAR